MVENCWCCWWFQVARLHHGGCWCYCRELWCQHELWGTYPASTRMPRVPPGSLIWWCGGHTVRDREWHAGINRVRVQCGRCSGIAGRLGLLRVSEWVSLDQCVAGGKLHQHIHRIADSQKKHLGNVTIKGIPAREKSSTFPSYREKLLLL